jgi:hypothetical protein
MVLHQYFQQLLQQEVEEVVDTEEVLEDQEVLVVVEVVQMVAELRLDQLVVDQEQEEQEILLRQVLHKVMQEEIMVEFQDHLEVEVEQEL